MKSRRWIGTALVLLGVPLVDALAQADGKSATPPAYVVLVVAGADADLRQAAETIRALHPNARELAFRPDRLDDLLPELRKIAPGFVCIVAPREVIDLRFARRCFLFATRVDDDPFPDFAYGFVTGDDGAHAHAFARNIAMAFARKRKQSILKVTSCEGEESVTRAGTIFGDFAHDLVCVAADDLDLERHLKWFANRDLITVTAHGAVGGMGSGYWSTHIDRSAPDLDGAVVISSVCDSGAVSRTYGLDEKGGLEENAVDAIDSFALSFLRRGAAAYVGGVDGMHGMYTSRVYEAVLLDGRSLGEAVKTLQDRMALELVDRKFAPERLLDLQKNDEDEAFNTVANLVVYGDPAMRLFPARLERLRVQFLPESGGVINATVAIDLEEFEAAHWVRSKYRLRDGKWGTECGFPLAWPDRRTPTAVRVGKSNVAAMAGRPAIFAVEQAGPARFLHVCVVYEADPDTVEAQVTQEGYRVELEIEVEGKGK